MREETRRSQHLQGPISGYEVGSVNHNLHSIPEMTAEDPAGLSPYCRVFIDGYPLEDFDQPLDNGKPAIELEMILLLAYEGG